MPKLSPLSITIIVLAVLFTLIGIGIILFYYLVMDKKILCTQNGKILPCNKIPTVIDTGEQRTGKACVRVVPPEVKTGILYEYATNQIRRQLKATDGKIYTEIGVAYPSEIMIPGSSPSANKIQILPKDSPTTLDENQVKRVLSVSINRDITKLVLTTLDNKKEEYDLSGCTFDGLPFGDYISRKQDMDNPEKCKKLSDDLRSIVKVLYPNVPDSYFKNNKGHPIWNGKCFKGMGAIPAGDWMCKPSDCSDKTYGAVTKTSDGKHCMVINRSVTNKGKYKPGN